MKRTKSFLVLVGITAVAVVAALSVERGSGMTIVSAEANHSRQWETMVVRGTGVPESIQGAANSRGNEGWELVTVTQTADGSFVIFLKRNR